jgi:uncharacterized membrane protein
MHWYLLLLRLTHIALGAIWVGTMVFMVVFLTPALRDAGPAGAPIMGSLQRRGFMVVMPVLALLTIISGFLLVERIYGGMSGLAASRMGQGLMTGAIAAILAFLLGVIVMRPAMTRAAALAARAGSASTEQERIALGAQVQRLRARSAVMGNVIFVLLLIALGAMAVARYL